MLRSGTQALERAVADNGTVLKYKSNAKEVLKDVDDRLILYGKIMEALV